MPTIAEHFKQEGRQVGREEGRKEGRQEGRQEGKQEAIQKIMGIRFGSVTPRIREILADINDYTILDQLLADAVQVNSLDEFMNCLMTI